MKYIIVLMLLLSSLKAHAEIRLATWNVKDILHISDVQKRAGDFENYYNDIKPDILLLQEITDCNALPQIAKIMNMGEAFFACSDFNKDGKTRTSFEVGIISKIKFQSIEEYDPYPDHRSFSQEYKFPNHGKGSRGFLKVHLESLNLDIINVHLKSSQGREGKIDKSNAQKRESVTQAIALIESVNLVKNPELSIIVAGDFNVGHSSSKNGINIKDDCYARCYKDDGYDETHAFLCCHLISGISMTNLSLNIEESSYPSFEGSPIDNIYAQGPVLNRVGDAQMTKATYGSDHRSMIIDIKDNN